MEQSYIERKCGCCKESLKININNVDEVIYYDKHYYHSSCFIDKCNKSSKSNRKSTAVKWEDALNRLDEIKNESNVYIRFLVEKEAIFNFMREAYDITNIPPYIFEKLSKIYNGTFKGMIKGIPPDHLLDMWKRKMSMLNQIYSNNETKGITMDSDERINYDLSILIGKYDSYLKWLEKQKAMEADKETKRNENVVRRSIGYNIHDNDEYNTDDISDLVDDIFG